MSIVEHIKEHLPQLVCTNCYQNDFELMPAQQPALPSNEGVNVTLDDIAAYKRRQKAKKEKMFYFDCSVMLKCVECNSFVIVPPGAINVPVSIAPKRAMDAHSPHQY